MNRIQPSKRRSSRFAAIAARICAVLFGSAALYYCLIPALAQDTEKYIYFDNGLAGYDRVQYSLDGTNFTDMLPLTNGKPGRLLFSLPPP